MANQVRAKVAVPPASPLAHPLPMDWQAQEKVQRDQRDKDFLRQNYTEVASIEKNINALVAHLPTVVDSPEACEAVAELAYMGEALQAMADPETPDATRGARIASTMVRDMFDSALKGHKITTIFPVCIRHHQHKDEVDKDEEESKKINQILGTYNTSQRSRTKITHHHSIPHFLAKINRETFSLTCKASRNVPLAAPSLNEDMLADAKTHAPLLLAIAHIPAIHIRPNPWSQRRQSSRIPRKGTPICYCDPGDFLAYVPLLSNLPFEDHLRSVWSDRPECNFRLPCSRGR